MKKNIILLLLIGLFSSCVKDPGSTKGIIEILNISNVGKTSATVSVSLDVLTVGDKSGVYSQGVVCDDRFSNPQIICNQNGEISVLDNAKLSKISATNSGKNDIILFGLLPSLRYYARAFVVIKRENIYSCFYSEPQIFRTEAQIYDTTSYIRLGSIGVQKTDLARTSLYEAADLCEASREGNYSDWRVPTIGELAIMYENRAKLGEIKYNYYWSVSSVPRQYWEKVSYYQLDMSDGRRVSAAPSDVGYVRAVRTLN